MHKIKSSHKIHWFIAIPGSKKLSLAATRSRSNFSLSSAQCTFQFLKFQSTLLHADREQENYWNMIIIQINFLLEYFLRSQKKAPERVHPQQSKISFVQATTWRSQSVYFTCETLWGRRIWHEICCLHGSVLTKCQKNLRGKTFFKRKSERKSKSQIELGSACWAASSNVMRFIGLMIAKKLCSFEMQLRCTIRSLSHIPSHSIPHQFQLASLESIFDFTVIFLHLYFFFFLFCRNRYFLALWGSRRGASSWRTTRIQRRPSCGDRERKAVSSDIKYQMT